MTIDLPISKSIANRLLILQAIHGDGLLTVSADMPDDVLLLRHALSLIASFTEDSAMSMRRSGGNKIRVDEDKINLDFVSEASRSLTISLGNCGTAMRFLTAYSAQLEGQTTILDGVARMHHRPIGQLVDALRSIGADIEYLGEEGFPPLRIKGCILDTNRIVTIDNPQSTQFVSALLLIGANVQTNSTSPYITLTREMIRNKEQGTKNKDKLVTTDQTEVTSLGSLFLTPYSEIERDWSAAAFWYEYVALHGGEIRLPGLFRDSLQGDKVVADIFSHLGVETQYTKEGIQISCCQAILNSKFLIQNFKDCPDLYPAVALTCERLGITLHATGVESLPLKESDRLRAVAEHRTDADHRMAMALMIAGYEVDDTACISKSYPQFLQHFRRISPRL